MIKNTTEEIIETNLRKGHSKKGYNYFKKVWVDYDELIKVIDEMEHKAIAKGFPFIDLEELKERIEHGKSR